MYEVEKQEFSINLKRFASTLGQYIAREDEWTIRGFIDVFRNLYTISADTKVVSKILELHIFPHVLAFAEEIGYDLELAAHQNWYPDLTFVNKENPAVKFAVDLKTTYYDEEHPGFCNGFTLGSHGEYFINRTSTKNIQYIGRNVDYYDSWDETQEQRLCELLKRANAKFMLSTWDHNEYRKNEYLDKLWNFCNKTNIEHFYHLGAKEANRKPMVEALLTNYTVERKNTGQQPETDQQPKNEQLSLEMFMGALT